MYKVAHTLTTEIDFSMAKRDEPPYTLFLPGRSHIITAATAARLIDALEHGRRVETIFVELNGEGSGAWEVVVNVQQVIAIVRHPVGRQHDAAGPPAGLRLVPR